jgi:glycosyltransferase involved in cell wall biosynthesis
MVTSAQANLKTRVLIVGPSPPPFNGMSVMTQVLLQNLGGNVHIIHLDTADRRGISNVGKLDFLNVVLALWHGLKFVYFLVVKHPDVVYVPVSQDMLPFLRDCFFLIPARILRKPVVVHLHGGHFSTFYSSQSIAAARLIRYSLGEAKGAVVLGQSLISAFDGIIPRNRVHVVPNGAPDLLWSGECEVSTSRPFTVLYLSLLAKEKGVFDLLRAVPLVVREADNCQFVFAGEWYRREEMQEAADLVKTLGIERYVRFAGTAGLAAKAELLNTADVFSLPTYYRYEGQPCAILEAMSAGLPIITTNVGCIPETVIDDENGFVLVPKSPAAIAERVLLLHNDPVRRFRMGAASRKRFLSHYTTDLFSKRLTHVLTQATDRVIMTDQPQESILS